MKDIKHLTLSQIYGSRPVKFILVGMLSIAALVSAFAAGQSLGFHKADFLCGTGGRYQQMFERNEARGNDQGFLPMMPPLPDSHGAVGEIVKIEDGVITVATPDNFEKAIRVNDDTLIRKFRDSITVSDLVVGDRVVVIGSPNDSSEVEARLIRVMPSIK
jgi:hypothetical protein